MNGTAITAEHQAFIDAGKAYDEALNRLALAEAVVRQRLAALDAARLAHMERRTGQVPDTRLGA